MVNYDVSSHKYNNIKYYQMYRTSTATERKYSDAVGTVSRNNISESNNTSYFSLAGNLNRKEDNDQESMQLPSTFRLRYQLERRTDLKQRHHNRNATSRS